MYRISTALHISTHMGSNVCQQRLSTTGQAIPHSGKEGHAMFDMQHIQCIHRGACAHHSGSMTCHIRSHTCSYIGMQALLTQPQTPALRQTTMLPHQMIDV
jgi:hypothetical protein